MNNLKLLKWTDYYKWTIIGYPVWLLIFWALYHDNPIVSQLGYFIYVTILYGIVIYLTKKIHESIKADRFNILVILSSLVVILIALSSVIFHDGWPLNHDHLTWKIHTETYVTHICKFDIIPIWSSRDGAGMGVPTPLYYHKTFYYISSFFYMLTGHIKTSILLTIGSFMLVGILGIYKTTNYLGNKKWISLILSLSFVFLNYTMCNWFLRGAMAEFSAMMIVPFLFLEELKLLKTKNYNKRLAIILFLIYLSHSVIGYYSLFTIVATLIILSFDLSKSQAIKIFKGLSKSALVIISVLLIYIIPMYILSDYFNPSQIKDNNCLPQLNYVEFTRYLYDNVYKWFSEPYWIFSVQFDLSVMILIIVAFALFLLKFKEHKISTFKKQAILLIVILDLFYIFLQLKYSVFFYEKFPGADFVQFPWRLLTFIQVLNLLILSWLLSYLSMTRFKKVAYVIPCIILISVIIFYPPFKGTSYRWYKNNELEQITTETCNVGEYIPSIYGDNFQFLHEHMYQFMQKGIEIKEKDNYLNILNANELKFEALQVNLEASFNNVSEVILPITYSGLSRLYKIYPNTNLKHQIPIWRTDSDPRIRAILPFGQYKLQLDLPTLKNIFIPKKKPYNRDRFEVIECDAEQLSPFGTFLVSKCGFHFFQNAECRSNEKAHSGKYSVKLIGNNSFGFTYKMNSLKDYLTDWEVSVWRYGNDKGTLIIQIGDKIFMSQNKSSEVDANGWELLKIRFKIPPQISEDDEIKFYVYNSLDKNPIYFDDFKLEAVEKKNTVWATTKAKTEPKTVEYFIQSINHNTNWLNLIKKETAKKNIPLDSLIKLNAIWMVQNQ